MAKPIKDLINEENGWRLELNNEWVIEREVYDEKCIVDVVDGKYVYANYGDDIVEGGRFDICNTSTGKIYQMDYNKVSKSCREILDSKSIETALNRINKRFGK